jgi:hypothetical protein
MTKGSSTIARRQADLHRRVGQAMAKKRGKANISGVKIVALEEGGLGWRILDAKGRPEKVRLGRIHTPPADDDAKKFQLSLKVLDQVLREAGSKASANKRDASARATRVRPLRMSGGGRPAPSIPAGDAE